MKLSESQKNILRFVGIRIASFLINVLLNTVRIRIVNSDVLKNIESQKKNYTTAFWHGSMLIGWFIQRKNNCASLVSQSKDGDVLTAILAKWNFKVVRGSSSKGGHDALDNMVKLLKSNFNLAITPDGPTGPIYKMKAGAIIAAQRSQTQLVLTGIGIKSKWRLKSWDKFEIPKPFTKAVVVYSNAISVENNLSKDEINKLIQDCENELTKLQKEATESV